MFLRSVLAFVLHTIYSIWCCVPQSIGDLVRYMTPANRRDFIDAAMANISERKLWGMPATLAKRYEDAKLHLGEWRMLSTLHAYWV